MKHGFLFDENLPKWWRRSVFSRDPRLTILGIGNPGAPPLGSPDPYLLEWCESNGYYLVTDNRRSMAVHLDAHIALGRHVPGVFRTSHFFPIDLLVEHLQLIEGASLPDEYRDSMTYLPIF